MADAIKDLFPKDKVMQELAGFVLLVDQWFDTFNSVSQFAFKSHKTLRCGYGVHLDEQMAILNSFIETIDSTVVCGKKSLMPWQKGCIISSNSLLAMFDTLKEQYDISYIITCRLNQDALESMFGVIRGMAGLASQMGALSFMQRLRNYILGAGGGGDIIISGANVESTEETEKVLTADMPQGILKPEDLELPKVTKISNDESDMANIDDIIDAFDNIEAEIGDDHLDDDIEDKELDDTEELGDAEDKFGSKTKEEAMKYVSGYLAKNSPDLGSTIANISEQEKFVKSRWIDLRNVFGLKYPTVEFNDDVKAMEQLFVNYHSKAPNGISRELGVTRNVIAILVEKFPKYDAKIIKRFVVTRTVYRMRFVRDLLRKQKESARSKKKKVDFQY